MNNLNNPEDINFWVTRLGLLPVPLFHKTGEQNQYILQNGSGNFCVDFEGFDVESGRNYAWSSDVSFFLSVKNGAIKATRWDKFTTEEYSAKSIVEKIDSFYNYLSKQGTPKSLSVVPYILYVFRQIRMLLKDKNGVDTIHVFLLLMASFIDEKGKDEIQSESWKLGPRAKETSAGINENRWEELLVLLKKGLSNYGLTPDVSLVLRHVSGKLFQEAHFEALFQRDAQLSFESMLPEIKFTSQQISYSSSHYTPPSLARTVVEEALKIFGDISQKRLITILDPACGSGEFLKECLRQLKNMNFSGDVKVIGWDISEAAVAITNFNLAFESRLWGSNLVFDVSCQNALSIEWKSDVDIILMNPPFISWEIMRETEREEVRETLGAFYRKSPNYASAFFLKACKTLNRHGVIGCILPSSILDGDSYKALREEIENQLSIGLIGKLGSLNIFSSALVDACIFTAKNTSQQEFTPMTLWCDYRIESTSTALRTLRKLIHSEYPIDYIEEDGFSIYKNPDIKILESWTPVAYNSWKTYKDLHQFKRVTDLFEIRQGARTGLNSVFLIEREYLDTLNQEEKNYFRPAVVNESIDHGTLVDSVYIFFPYGEAIIESEDQLQNAVPQYYESILLPNKRVLQNRRGHNNSRWWELTRHRTWQVSPMAKIVSTEFGKRGSFAYDLTGRFVVERGHGWIPKELIKNDYTLADISYAYVCVLNMPIIDTLLNAISKQIGGGQWYLASKYIYEMPFPDFFGTNVDHALIKELTNVGISLSKGDSIPDEYLSYLQTSTFR